MNEEKKNGTAEFRPPDQWAFDDLTRLNNELVNLQRELARKNAEIVRQRDWLDVVLSSIGDGVIATDRAGRIVLLNPVAEQLTGWTRESAHGRRLGDVLVLKNGETGSPHPDLLAAVLERGAPCGLAEDTVLVTRDGRAVAVDDSAAPLRDEQGNISGCVIVFRDVTRRKQMEQRLRELALRDGLTDLYNHREFYRMCREECGRAQRYGAPLALLMLDIDFFKRINDTLGHPCGDEVLRFVARTLVSVTRASDRAARYGGEEFAVIMPQSGVPEAVAAAERIRMTVAERTVSLENGGTIAVTVSIGVAGFPDHGRTEQELVKAADTALYRAKQTGRNRVCAAEDVRG